ncbi:MAG: N-6 DNA methylase [Alphaproteobacteria bacterium]
MEYEAMDIKELITKLGFKPKNGTVDVYSKIYQQHDGYSIDIDFLNEKICYGDLIGADCKTTQNFSQPENFVVLECVNRLLEKGYNPQNIILEKTWAAGHCTSGRLDICVTRDDGSEYLLIECKTFGKEFDKAVARMYKDGGQLFTYFKFSNKADIIMLYTSELQDETIVYKNEIVKIEDDYRTGDVKDFYEKWNKLAKNNGIFEVWVKPYCFESKTLTLNDLKPITQEDSSFIFNQFLEILRHNVVSDKGNAFNKIFTLFLCKVYDETSKKDDEELDFQWKEGFDDHVKFQLRLTDLYKNGMLNFLDRKVSDFNNEEFENKYKFLDENTRKELKEQINRLRLEKNNEFAIKEVYDHDSFVENAKIVKEVVELLQGYRIRYNKRQQYLSDFFELLLTTGLKQEAGQFFTPVPIAQFIIKSLPLEKIIDEHLKSKNGELLPYMIDYAAGSGHFITEYMHEVQNIIDQKDPNKYIPGTKKDLMFWQNANYEWATKYVYGIEKDYRLVKVGKVGCYLHGDGLANVILSDGLGNFVNTEDYKGILRKNNYDGSMDNQQFDIILSNPPYSVSSFRQTTRDFYTEKDFELYNYLTDNSSEIECLFVERTKQLLKDGGIAGVILPSSILTNTGIYTKTRELLLKYFEIVAITELGSNTFMATGTNTVVLFLRRKNNYDCINLQKSIDKFFTDKTDVTINNIETPVSKYVNYVWEDLTFDDYLTLLNKEPNEKVEKHDIFKEYSQKIKSKSDKEFWNKVLEIEKEKLYYFILAYPQKIVTVKTGEKDAEKQFLGYEFSNRRGSEGIHAIQRGKSIDECTHLFDMNAFDNPQKASTYIYKAFNGDTTSAIADSLKENISRVNLLDMMTFDRVDFEKVINIKAKKKIKIESKWNFVKLSNVATCSGGNSFPKEFQNGKIGTAFLKVSDMNLNENNRFINVANNYVTDEDLANIKAKQFGINTIIFPKVGQAVKTNKKRLLKIKSCIDNNIMALTVFNNCLLPEFLFEYFVNYVNLTEISNNANPPAISSQNLGNLLVPLPPLDIQQKIVDEVEEIEQKRKKIITKISVTNNKIYELLNNLYVSATSKIRLGEASIFELSIGKRVLNSDLIEGGKYPVYSANVFEPFGYVNNLLINKFDTPSVIWGIDGDWMTNIIPANIPFYPTDHCGIIKILKEQFMLEKYLAFALNNEGKQFGFSRTKRASIDRVSGITIPVPSFSEQQKIVAQIEELEKQIAEAQAIIDNSNQQKQEILDKYLK